MYRTVLIPENRDVHIKLPLKMVGKEIEISINPTTKTKKLTRKSELENWIKIKKFYYSIVPNTVDYKFDRDEANER